MKSTLNLSWKRKRGIDELHIVSNVIGGLILKYLSLPENTSLIRALTNILLSSMPLGLIFNKSSSDIEIDIGELLKINLHASAQILVSFTWLVNPKIDLGRIAGSLLIKDFKKGRSMNVLIDMIFQLPFSSDKIFNIILLASS